MYQHAYSCLCYYISVAVACLFVYCLFTDGADFTGGHFTAMFAPNQKRAAVPVSILNDTVAEGDETFSASLSVSSEFKALGVKVGTPNKATVIIEDDDGIVCQFSPTQYSVKEDVGMAVLTLLCSGVAMEDYTLEITTANGTAQSERVTVM